MNKEQGFEEECIFSCENFQQTVCGNVASFLTKGAFVDVQLTCGGEVVKAHKVILAACSPFFEKMLISDPHLSINLVFPDITKDEIMLLLDFMYKGRVSVVKSLASSLLKTAKKLQICGLEDQQVDNPQETSTDEVEQNNETTPNLSQVLTENVLAPSENQNNVPAVDHAERNEAPKSSMVDRISPKKQKRSKKVINHFAKKKQSVQQCPTIQQCDPDAPGPSKSVQKPLPLIPSSPKNRDRKTLKGTNSHKNKKTKDVTNDVEEPGPSKDCESEAPKEPFPGFTALPVSSLQNFCVVCQKKEKNIKDHISKVHNKPIRLKKFTCKTCSVKFYLEKSLEMHKCKQAKK